MGDNSYKTLLGLIQWFMLHPMTGHKSKTPASNAMIRFVWISRYGHSPQETEKGSAEYNKANSLLKKEVKGMTPNEVVQVLSDNALFDQMQNLNHSHEQQMQILRNNIKLVRRCRLASSIYHEVAELLTENLGSVKGLTRCIDGALEAIGDNIHMAKDPVKAIYLLAMSSRERDAEHGQDVGRLWVCLNQFHNREPTGSDIVRALSELHNYMSGEDDSHWSEHIDWTLPCLTQREPGTIVFWDAEKYMTPWAARENNVLNKSEVDWNTTEAPFHISEMLKLGHKLKHPMGFAIFPKD